MQGILEESPDTISNRDEAEAIFRLVTRQIRKVLATTPGARVHLPGIGVLYKEDLPPNKDKPEQQRYQYKLSAKKVVK